MKTVITAETRKAIADGVSKSLAGQRAMSKAADALQAEGIVSEMLFAPKDKNADRSLYNSVCEAVVLGFAKSVQELLQKPAKSLRKTSEASPSKMEQTTGDKRYWEQQIGSKVKDLRNMSERRAKKAERERLAKAKKEGVRLGMTKQQVLESSWGRPERINRTTNALGSREQWVYGGVNFLYFEGDRLTAIQN